MNNKGTVGFVLVTNGNGIVQDVRRDEMLDITVGEMLHEKLERASIVKLLSFYQILKDENSSLGWELNFEIEDKFYSVHVGGFKEKDSFYIIGSNDVQETRKYINELTALHSEEQMTIRQEAKFQSDLHLNSPTVDSYNELSKINNEMANLQRELQKKNQELEDLNAQLKEKNAELDQFTYIVSHDLKAPLRGISSLIQIIDEDFKNDLNGEVLEFFDLIKVRADRMSDLIVGILDYAKAGKEELKKTRFTSSELISEVMATVDFPESCEVLIPENQVEFEASFVQLSQILANIVGNAIKYHHDPNQAKIQIILTPTEGFAKFEIRDNGPGIPEKFQHKIFEPFETANTESRTDSTGIGLAIVQKLVQQNGGEIGLESKEGEGSNFWFTFPCVNSVITEASFKLMR